MKHTLQAHAAWLFANQSPCIHSCSAAEIHFCRILKHAVSSSELLLYLYVLVSFSRCRLQDIGMDPRRPDTRVYGTSLAQPWHTDSSDIVGEFACSDVSANEL